MSLYYDAAAVLTAPAHDGSLKSRIYDNRLGLRSKPAHVYALISETAKYDVFLKEVIENAGLLAQEPKLTPILSLLLTHDHLVSKKGLAAPSSHPLRLAIERNKARLQAEFTKARLRRRCGSVDDLKRHLLAEKPRVYPAQPRWARINTLKTTLKRELASTFKDYRTCHSIGEVINAAASDRVLLVDPHVPEVVALPPRTDLTKTEAYRDGRLILQDKASCFPALMLIGDEEQGDSAGDCIDGCAAPGNKTSHLAALLRRGEGSKRILYACERDARRSETLKTMMEKSGADLVVVKAKCDFLTLDPHDRVYQQVTHLLLDPSCSGSGIVGREDVPSLALPDDFKTNNSNVNGRSESSRKRKRDHDAPTTASSAPVDANQAEETRQAVVDKERLRKLSDVQTRIVEHALSFSAAVRVTYSTCSVHVEENEGVVARILASSVARDRGWRLLRRTEQVTGLRLWRHRGLSTPELEGSEASDLCLSLDKEDLEACIRAHPGDAEGTMGFFVCCFVRAAPGQNELPDDGMPNSNDSWEGFSD